MPPSEPTPADFAAVAAVVDGTPPAQPAPQPGQVVQPQQPAPQPAQPAPAQQPAQPTPQPAPSQQPAGDPFESLFTPTEPTAPTQQPAQPAQPTEPVAPPTQPTVPQVPTPQPGTPTGTPQPTPNPAPGSQPPAFQSYDDYLAAALGNDTPVAIPDHSKIAPDDEAGIKQFFDDLVDTAVKRAEQKISQQNAIQNTERQLWDAAFEQYGSLKTNKKLRDMVHNIRMGEFRKGNALTPIQAAEQLLDALKAAHQRGVADNTVVTTIESTQPNNGGGGQPVPTSLDREQVLTAVQTGGETALAAYLDNEVKAGRL